MRALLRLVSTSTMSAAKYCRQLLLYLCARRRHHIGATSPCMEPCTWVPPLDGTAGGGLVA